MKVLGITAGIVALDQVTKQMLVSAVAYGDAIPVIPGIFNISHVRNTGAAFGSLSDSGPLLVLISLFALVILLWNRTSIITGSSLRLCAFAMAVGGIVGNLMDRIRLSYVVDFLDFHAGVHHFPSFNVADSAICIGVALFMASAFLARKAEAGPKPADAGSQPTGNV